MAQPLVYIAVSPELVEELSLDEHLQRLQPVAHVERWPGPGQSSAEAVADALRRAQVIITGWGTPPLEPLREWTPETFNVRLVAHTAGTVKRLIPVQALERGVLVTHANHALAAAVAEFTIGAIVAARRQIVQSAIRMRAGQPRLPVQQMHELSGSTIGIIGASTIGRRVLQLLAPWDATLLLYDPYCPPQAAAGLGATLVPLDDLMRRSDVVSLHAPVTEETIGMLGAAQFSAMKDGALFVNTARGRLIDHDALLAELQSGRISALLDVTDPNEPLPADSPFFQLENCIVLPHIAGISVQARWRQGSDMIDETLRFLAGEPLRYQVTLARWDIMA